MEKMFFQKNGKIWLQQAVEPIGVRHLLVRVGGFYKF